MPVQIQIRNGTAAQWTSANPTLAAGEVGIENDTRKQKFGDGTTAWNSLPYAGGGTVTSVTGTSPVASSGGATPAISLTSGYGDTQNPYVSKTANQVLAAPNGSAGVPSFRALVSTDIPTLNQNTTGTAAGLSATLAIASGGTGATTAISAFNALAPSQTANSGKYLTTDGTNTSWGTVSGGGTPGGANTNIQFNSSSTFGGSANLTWDGTNVQLGGTGALRFADTDNSNYVAFKSPGTVASNVTWTLPAADGTSSQVLSTNGSGTLSWATAGGGGSPGGTNTQVQFNSSGAFAGSANLTFDGTTLTAAGFSGPLNGTVGATTANTGTFSSTVHKGATSGTVTMTAPAVAGTQSYTLPSALPTASGQVLSCTTAGVMSWVDSGPATTLSVSYLVIAGGGGGGSNGSGGGGAGGYRSSISGESSGGGASAESALTLNLSQAYQVTVGAFGTGSTYPTNPTSGGSSTFASIVSVGGGAGGSNGIPGAAGQNGGSGGGTGAGTGSGFGNGTANQGFTPTGRGGGGAGSDNGSANFNGGAGVSSSVTGSSVGRAGGGGGSGYTGGTTTAGGGAGGAFPGGTGAAGTANLGGGGGGGPNGAGNGGNGGTGVIFLRIPSTNTATFSGGVISSVATVGANKVYTITAAGGGDTVTFT